MKTPESKKSSNQPFDFEILNSWIQPQHLQNKTIRKHRDAFISHPVKVLTLKNFLHKQMAIEISNFVNNEAIFETLYGLYSAMEKDSRGNPTVPENEWLEAEEKDRFFRLRKFTQISTDNKLTPNLVRYLSFTSAFKKPVFKNYFEDLTGLTFDMNSETFHLFKFQKGDFLRSHTDRGTDYLLAFMLYLTPNWKSDFGGVLNIALPDRKFIEFEPEFNCLIVFSVIDQAEHFVTTINESAGDLSRSAFSGWLHRAPVSN